MNVFEVPFEPKASQSIIATAKDWLVTNKSKFSKTANFCIYFENDQFSKFLQQNCHSNILFSSDKSFRLCVATENGASRSSFNKTSYDLVLPFLLWFLNESYMGRYILNRDDPDFCYNYGFVVSADVYTPLMQNVLITTRHFYECSKEVFEKFNALCANGVSAKLAYLFCFCTNYSGDDNLVCYSNQNHRAQGLLKLNGLRNFMNDTYPNDVPTTTYRTTSDYNGGINLFYKKADCVNLFANSLPSVIDDLFRFRSFTELLAIYRKTTLASTPYVPPNPFSLEGFNQQLTPPNSCTFQEVWDLVIPFILNSGVLNDDYQD